MSNETELEELTDQWSLENCEQLIRAVQIETSSLPPVDTDLKIGKAPAKGQCMPQYSMLLGEKIINGQEVKLYINRKSEFFLYRNDSDIQLIPNQRARFWIKTYLRKVPAYYKTGGGAYKSLAHALGIAERDNNIEVTPLFDIEDNQRQPKFENLKRAKSSNGGVSHLKYATRKWIDQISNRKASESPSF